MREQMVGVLGLVMVMSAVSGLVLWWPRDGMLPALVQLRRRPRQVLYRDVHALVGVWSALVLLPVAVTGDGVVFPGLIRPLVRSAPPVATVAAPQVPDRGLPFMVDADRAVALAPAVAPGETVIFVEPPQDRHMPGRSDCAGATPTQAYRVVGVVWIDPGRGPWRRRGTECAQPGRAADGHAAVAA